MIQSAVAFCNQKKNYMLFTQHAFSNLTKPWSINCNIIKYEVNIIIPQNKL